VFNVTKIKGNLTSLVILGIVILGAILFSGCTEQTEKQIGDNITKETVPEETVSSHIATSEKVSEPHWTYEGEEGPEHWATLGYPDCAGKEQSPIDVPNKTPLHANDISFNYNPSVLEISNNGHTIKVADENNSEIIVDGNTYRLQQYHFHAPSEHTFNGTYYDMELHLVHQSDAGKYTVVGVMMKSGSENKAYAPIWDHLPAMKGEPENITNVNIDANDLLPANLSYYRYNGSFTTPPCTEGVNWFMLSTPVELSKTQIEAFQAIYSSNNRPILPLNQRKFI
jgi:carbonic anhydrase